MLPPFPAKYIQLAQTSEASEFLYVWAAMSGTAAILGRNVRLRFGSGYIIPNLYLMFVGDPGTRKSSAIKEMKRLMKHAGYTFWCGDKVTMQKLLADLAGVDEEGKPFQTLENKDFKIDEVTLAGLGLQKVTAETVELFVCQDEFSDFIGLNNFGMLALFCTFWDIAEPYEYRIRTGASLHIPTPTINILGGTTPGQFNMIFPPSAAEQGLLSRMIIVSAAPTGKKFHHPLPQDPALVDAVVDHWKKVRTLKGDITISKEADELLKGIYHSWKPMEDGRFAYYGTRRHTQLLKLCIINACDRYELVVRASDVMYANTLLTYTERHMPDALGAFGKETNSDVSNRIVDMLGRSHRPLAPAEIFPTVQRDILFVDFIKLLASMTQGSLIQSVGGKYLVKKAPIQRPEDRYVDWSLLKGVAPDLVFDTI
jgi:Protein of unknown function (DUF3987)